MNVNHLTALKTAEATTLAAIDNATAELNRIGTDALAAALERFRGAANAAAERLATALPTMAEIADSALASINVTLAQIVAAFTLPAPAEETDPSIPTREEPKSEGGCLREEMEQQADDQPQPAESASEQTAPAAMTDSEFTGAVKRIIGPERLRDRKEIAAAANSPVKQPTNRARKRH